MLKFFVQTYVSNYYNTQINFFNDILVFFSLYRF